MSTASARQSVGLWCPKWAIYLASPSCQLRIQITFNSSYRPTDP